MNQLNANALGLAAGILEAIFMFLLTLFALWAGYAMNVAEFMQPLYPGYAVTGAGSIVGAIYGFILGYIKFFILAWLYNRFSLR